MANKRIIDAVLAKKAEMSDRAVAGQNRVMAVAALKGGIRSPEWRAYMMQFVEQRIPGIPVDQRQLDRLLGTDGTLGSPDLDTKRAYMIAGGPCGPDTRLLFGQFVNSIDIGLEPDCLLDPKQRSSKKKSRKKKGAKKGTKYYSQ